jgi:subtilisin family serine protease
LRAATDARVVDSMPSTRTEVVKVARRDVDETIAALESSPDVEFAEPNFYVHSFATPNDPRYDQQWALNNTAQSVSGIAGTADADIDAPEAWDVTTGSSASVVAIIDTGVAYNHPDLAANIWANPGEAGTKQANGTDDDGNGFTDDARGWDWVDDDNEPRDFFGHGTHVAGIIGATGNDSYGGVGVNWDVSLMPLRVLDGEGVGTTADVAAAVNYAAANGADIINLSLGGPDFSLSVQNAIGAATDALVVVAAGNEATNNDLVGSFPCNYASANIVCVAASESNDTLAGYSNYGGVNVDLAAPGSRILSTFPAFTRALRENFEADIATTWIAGGTGTQWSRGLDDFGYFAADSDGSNYSANTDSWLRTATPIGLGGQDNCTLTYVFELDTGDDGDAFEVEASPDGTTWSHVGGFTGSTGGDWLTANHDLSAHDGSAIHLRFRLESNALFNGDGVSIDDIQIKCLTLTYSGTEFSYFSGTSMATPYVSGAAALVLAAAPESTVANVRSAVLNGVDVVSGLSGKVATGGRLNVAKALGVVVPNSVPTASPSPSSSTSPDPNPTDIIPDPDPSEEPTSTHARSVTLNLRSHLIAKGRVSVADGFSACRENVVVRITRRGNLVKKVRAATDGTYRVHIPDRAGRYVARVAKRELTDAICAASSSAKVRHRHL